MKLADLLERIRSSHRVILGRLAVGIVVLNVLDNLPAVVDKRPAHTWVEHLPGFWTVFGLVGCVLIIILSKAYGHAGIMRPEEPGDE